MKLLLVQIKRIFRRWRKKLSTTLTRSTHKKAHGNIIPETICSSSLFINIWTTCHAVACIMSTYIIKQMTQFANWLMEYNTSRRLWSLAMVVITFHVITSLFQSSVFKLPHFDDVLALSFIETFIGTLISGVELYYMTLPLTSVSLNNNKKLKHSTEEFPPYSHELEKSNEQEEEENKENFSYCINVYNEPEKHHEHAEKELEYGGLQHVLACRNIHDNKLLSMEEEEKHYNNALLKQANYYQNMNCNEDKTYEEHEKEKKTREGSKLWRFISNLRVVIKRMYYMARWKQIQRLNFTSSIVHKLRNILYKLYGKFISFSKITNNTSKYSNNKSKFTNTEGGKDDNNTLSLRICCTLSFILACSLYLSNTASHLLSFQLQVMLKSSKLLFTALVHRIVFGSVSSHLVNVDVNSKTTIDANEINNLEKMHTNHYKKISEVNRYKNEHCNMYCINNKSNTSELYSRNNEEIEKDCYSPIMSCKTTIYNSESNCERTKNYKNYKKVLLLLYRTLCKTFVHTNTNKRHKKHFLYSLCSALFEVEFICCVLVVAGTICFTLAENKQFVQRSVVDEHAHELLNTLHVRRPSSQWQMEHLHENSDKIKNKETMEISISQNQLEKMEQNEQIMEVIPETTIQVVKIEQSTEIVLKEVIKDKNVQAVNKSSNNNTNYTATFANFSDHSKIILKEDDKETCFMCNVTSKRVIKKTPLDDVEVVAIEESHRDETSNNNYNKKIDEIEDKESNKEKAYEEKGKDNNVENEENENIIERKCTQKSEQCDDATEQRSKSKPDKKQEEHKLRKNYEEEKEKEKRTNNNNINNNEDMTKTNNRYKDNEQTKNIQHHEPHKKLKSNQSTGLLLSFIFTSLKLNTVLAVGCVVLSNVLDSIMYAVEEKYCLLGTSQEEQEQQPTVNMRYDNDKNSKPFISEDAERVLGNYPTLETENIKDHEEKEEEELLIDAKDIGSKHGSSERAKEVVPSSSSSSSSLVILNTLMFYMNCFAALIYGSIWGVYSLYSYFSCTYMNNANQMNNNSNSKSNSFHDYTKLWMYASCAALASNIGTTALLAIIAEESSTTAVLITVIRKTLTVLLSFCQYDSHDVMKDTHHEVKNYTIGIWGLWSVQFTVLNGFTREHGLGLLLLMSGLTAYEYVRRNKNTKKNKKKK